MTIMEDPIQKPVPMSLYSTWEVERTAPNCIPRICSFKLQRIKLTKPLDPEVTSLTICASMSVGSFHRTLRTDEISLDKNGVLDTELDLFFSLQYPHFLKREQNVLNLSLQRRKRYRNRTIPGGYKTLAMGSLDMAQVMQCPFDDTLKLFAKGGGFQVAQIKLHQVTSLPHDNLRSHSGENSSTEEDDPELYFSEDELDSEGEERGRDKSKKHNKDNLRLKKRFNALLKKIKINDDALVEANDVLPGGLPPEEFSQTFSSLMAEISDDSGHSDSDSIGTLPKPALRPYFDADINSKVDQNIGRYKERRISPVEKGSSTDEGLVTKPSQTRVSTSPVPIKSTRSASQCSNSSAKVGEGGVRGEVQEMRSPRNSPLCQKSPHTTQQNSSDSGDAGPSSLNTHFTRSRSTSLEESRGLGREELSITEQFSSVIGSSDRIPSHMILCFDRDAPAHPIVRLMNNSHSNCIFLQSPSDPKVFLSSLVSKMQKYMNRHSSLPNISLTVIGDFASFSAILIPLTDVLSTKSVEWMKHFTFIFINTGEGPDHPICDYISSNDHCYCNMISAITQQEDITPLISYQQQATDTIQLCIGRVLVTQSVDEGGDQKDVQSDLPFLHSVQVVVKNKYTVVAPPADCKVDEHKGCTDHEVEFQVDYSTLPNKKENNVKQSLKGVFKNLGIYREFNGKEGQLYVKADYRKKENKGLQRLNKKSADLIPIHSSLSSNFLCMSKQLFTVSVDGVELNDVSFFSVMPQWSSVVKTLPVSISPSGVLC